ncbi:MAG: hypothetical protein M8353_07015 [ANME-2 cluster archaeon]|nr:hypothetical protein [ANME-2 cluster archaeon]
MKRITGKKQYVFFWSEVSVLHNFSNVWQPGNDFIKCHTDNIDVDTIGTLVAMLTRYVHTAKELNTGEIEYLLVNTQKGKIITIKADPNSIFTALMIQMQTFV